MVTVAFEYTEHKLKFLGSFDKRNHFINFSIMCGNSGQATSILSGFLLP